MRCVRLGALVALNIALITGLVVVAAEPSAGAGVAAAWLACEALCRAAVAPVLVMPVIM